MMPYSYHRCCLKFNPPDRKHWGDHVAAGALGLLCNIIVLETFFSHPRVHCGSEVMWWACHSVTPTNQQKRTRLPPIRFSLDFLGKRLIRCEQIPVAGHYTGFFWLIRPVIHKRSRVLNSVDLFLWMIHYDACHLPQSQQMWSRLAKDFDFFMLFSDFSEELSVLSAP